MTQRQLPGGAFADAIGTHQRQLPGSAFATAPSVGGGAVTGSSAVTLDALGASAAGVVVSGVSGTSNVSLAAVVSAASGEVTGAGVVTGSSSVALGSLGTTATAAVGATLTIGPFKNKSGTLLVAQTIAHLVAMAVGTRAVVATAAGLSTNASGVLTLRDSNFVPGTGYMVATWNADGSAAGNARVTAAAV